MKRKLTKAAVMFFGIMIVCTILARAAYNISTPKVQVGGVSEMYLGPEVFSSGVVEASREAAVVTVGQQLIKTVAVIPGQTVEKGAVLFELDMEKLAENIELKKNELNGLDLQIQSAKSSQEAERQSRKLMQSQAEADYKKAMESGDSEMIAQAKRALDQANLPVMKDTSIEQMNLNRQGVEKDLQKLVELEKQQGKITAPVKGVVSEVNVKVGSMTSGLADILIEDASSGLIVKAQFQEENREYVVRGASVILSGGQMKKKAVIDAVGDSKDGGNMIEAMVVIPPDSFTVGTPLTLEVETAKQHYFDCLPLSALHQEGAEEYAVYVLDTKKSMLGDEIVAAKIPVTVEYKGEYAAAVSGLQNAAEVILSSDRQIKEGGRVKPLKQ